MDDPFDILIVGGGMVGATIATVLRNSQYRVGLIESRPLAFQESTDAERSTAISYGSRRILERFGVWSDIVKYAEPIKHIHVSSRGRLGVTRIDAIEAGVPALGYVVENNRLSTHLYRHLQSGEVKLFAPASLRAIKPGPAASELIIEHNGGEHHLHTKLLIAADGAMSGVRDMLGIEAKRSDYDQSAIVCNVSSQLHHNNIAYERFTESGPLAFLPLFPSEQHDPRCAIVWTVSSKDLKSLLDLSDREFLAALQQQFGCRLGKLLQVSKRAAFPLALIHSRTRIAARTVLIGNAAQSLHPVAGQGFNLALRDSAALLECLLRQDACADPGESALLAEYERARKRDQRRMMYFTDTLVRLFGSRLPLLAHARAKGLLLLDLLPPLRHFIATQSMGTAWPLPRIGYPPV